MVLIISVKAFFIYRLFDNLFDFFWGLPPVLLRELRICYNARPDPNLWEGLGRGTGV
jgi:hypothetical protein